MSETVPSRITFVNAVITAMMAVLYWAVITTQEGEIKIARLETAIATLTSAVAELRTDIRELRKELKH